jgi:ribonuclease PH
MQRSYNRTPNQLRPIKLTPDFVSCAEGSVLIEVGKTRVLCNASVSDKPPRWLEGTGKGWITAEYSLLPRSTDSRVNRERKGASGRTQEIQRLIGRSLRATANLAAMEGCLVTVDCDVIEADGGTRTASIVGGFVALGMALTKWKKDLPEDHSAHGKQIFEDYVTAVSVGVLEGKPILDLDYPEDSAAEVDMNVVIASISNKLIEVQGTGEESTFSRNELNQLLDLGEKGASELLAAQRALLGELP